MPCLATLVSILDLAVSEDSDRMVWITRRRMLKEWMEALVFVKPDTVVKYRVRHRKTGPSHPDVERPLEWD